MAISGIDQFKLAMMSQQYGAMFQAGMGTQKVSGTVPQTPENVTGVGTEIESASKFNWKSLNKFDGTLLGATPQTNIGKTSEVPTENIFTANPGGESTPLAAYEKPNNGLFAALNRIDAQDIALNSNKNGLNGQRYINFLA